MKLFGTDGIRGRVNSHPITPETVLKVGMAIGRILYHKRARNMILIGKDTRLSGYMIESALTSGICSMGMNVTLVGPIPTPGIAYLTRTLRLDAGIVISASHNSYEDNGIKIFSSMGFKLPDDQEQAIEELVLDEGLIKNRPEGNLIGKAYRLPDAIGRYIEYIKSTIPRMVDFEEFKIVVDSANGATYKVTTTLLRELGANVISINDKPNGTNINADCGALHLNKLSETVKKTQAHLGIAHDGDGDRTIFCDENGKIIDGDLIMAIWATDLKKDGLLTNDTVVSTVMSNLGFEHYLNSCGIKLIRAQVGDRYVVEQMIKSECTFGGEQSGHIISLNHNTTGDGPITALQILNIMKKTNKTLSELVSDITLYPQILKNIPVTHKKDINQCPDILAAVASAQDRLEDKGRVLVRPSGTEKKIRIMVEGQNESLVAEITEDIARAVKKSMQ